MSNYIDMDMTMEHMNDEIDTCDELIGGHIERGVQMKDLWSLARLRANLSTQRKALAEAMDKEASVTEVCFTEERDFDSEITMSGKGFISVDTHR